MAANNNNRDTEADKLLEKLKKKLKDGNVSFGAVAPKKYLVNLQVESLKLARQRQLADEDKKRKLEGNSAPAAAAEKDEVDEKTPANIHKGGRRRKTKRKSKRKRKHKRKTRSHKGGSKRTRRHKHKRKTKRRRTKRRRRR